MSEGFLYYMPKTQSGFASIIILIIVVASSIGIIIFSDEAKYGDILFTMDQGIEEMVLSVYDIAPNERFHKLTVIATERLHEAKILETSGNRQYYWESIEMYDSSLERALFNMDLSLDRGWQLYNFLPQFSEDSLSNLQILSQMYTSDKEADFNRLDKSVEVTIRGYEKGLSILEQTRSEEENLDNRIIYYDIQDELRSVGASFQVI